MVSYSASSFAFVITVNSEIRQRSLLPTATPLCSTLTFYPDCVLLSIQISSRQAEHNSTDLAYVYEIGTTMSIG